MRTFPVLLTAFIVLVAGCRSAEKNHMPSAHFKSFEISATNGWGQHFSLWVDSSKIFFSPQAAGQLKYGLLPDPVYDYIDAALVRIIADSAIKSTNMDCLDCTAVSLQTIIGTDTFNIHQTGDIHLSIQVLLKSLQTFADTSHAATLPATLLLETQKQLYPTPLKR